MSYHGTSEECPCDFFHRNLPGFQGGEEFRHSVAFSDLDLAVGKELRGQLLGAQGELCWQYIELGLEFRDGGITPSSFLCDSSFPVCHCGVVCEEVGNLVTVIRINDGVGL